MYPKNRKTHMVSEETKRKIGLANLGKKRTDEQRRNISIATTGRVVSEETKKKISVFNKGKKMPEATRVALLKSRLGFKHSEQTKKHWSEIRKGKKHSLESRIKNSIAHIGKKQSPEHVKHAADAHSGDKCNFWKGGIWGSPYNVDWTATLRRSIRERDGYICKICGMPQGDRALSVHHIDYNKLNCDPKNLISLCWKCHAATNSDREYWIKYFA
jgi:hypothetical protein